MEYIDRKSAPLKMRVSGLFENTLDMAIVIVENDPWYRLWGRKKLLVEFLNSNENGKGKTRIMRTYHHSIWSLRSEEGCAAKYNTACCNTQLLVMCSAATKYSA